MPDEKNKGRKQPTDQTHFCATKTLRHQDYNISFNFVASCLSGNFFTAMSDSNDIQ